MDDSVDLGSSIGGSTNGNNVNNGTSGVGTSNGGVSNGSINLWNGYELINRQISTDNTTTTNTTTNNATTTHTNPEDGGSNHGASVGSTVILGLPQPCPPVYTESTAYLAKMDNLFRFDFSRTQTMNYIHQKLECTEFCDLFKEMKIKTEALIAGEYCLDGNLNVVLVNSAKNNGVHGGGLDPDEVAKNTAGECSVWLFVLQNFTARHSVRFFLMFATDSVHCCVVAL